MTCLCGRRIVRDRSGEQHARCGTCRREAAEATARAGKEAFCVDCQIPIDWNGRGRQPPARCPLHLRVHRRWLQHQAQQRRKSA